MSRLIKMSFLELEDSKTLEEQEYDHEIEQDLDQENTLKADRLYALFLTLSILISFGSHFTKNAFPIFGYYLINSHFITPKGFGVILASGSLPSIFVPVLVGTLLDQEFDLNKILLLSVIIMILGQGALFCCIFQEWFIGTLFSEFLFSFGSSSVVTIQRILLVYYFEDRYSLSLGLSISASNIAKFLGRVTIAPIVELSGSLKLSFLIPLGSCLISLLSAIGFIHYSNIKLMNYYRTEAEIVIDSRSNLILESKRYYFIIFLHGLYIFVFHTSVNFIPYFAAKNLKYSSESAGFISSIPAIISTFISPFVGKYISTSGYQYSICFIASLFVLLTYMFLIFNALNPVVALTLISFAQVFLLTITLVEISKWAPHSYIGSVFGFIESSDAIISFLGNLYFGALFSSSESYFRLGIIFILIIMIFGSLISFQLTKPELRRIFSQYEEID